MIVIICLDDNDGMMFNKRRQSSDSTVIDRIIEETVGNTRILMNAYSEKQFANHVNENIIVSEQFLMDAKEGEYCFAENVSLCDYVEKIEKIIVFRWNRKYPSDFKLDISLASWELTDSVEFIGNSHEKLTKEVYI